MKRISSIRPSPIAGTWYSGDPERLAQTVDNYLKDADPPEVPGEVVGLVAPHAGYQYSGPVAGYAFKTVQGRHFDRVVVLSPMHQYMPHPLLTSAHEAYQTPLGQIPLAEDTLAEINTQLKGETGIQLIAVSKDKEHSLEIELPFLQRTLSDDFKLVPIMMRDQSRQLARTLGQILAESLDSETTLLVASSDLSHFYTEARANELDRLVLGALDDFSPEKLFDLHEQGLGQACGLSPIATVLWAARAWGADQVTLLDYNTSAAVTGDRSSVVGYGAAAITRPD
ncbi:MAG: AmmeMemoRadiSam system protein B [Chloroflexota bacterium]|nr:AmmeMemoRadiSam system protein B [Chloroflexota bacterium]